MDDDQPAISSRAERLLSDFERHPGTPAGLVDALRVVIDGSPSLAAQIDTAVSRGLLTRFELLPRDANAFGEYHPRARLIKLRPDVQDSLGTSAFVLGHETQHALNSPISSRAVSGFHQEVARSSVTTHDYTTAVRTLIQSSRWDEASATLVGWNALVGYVGSIRRHVRLSDITEAAPLIATDFVVARGRKSRYFVSLSADDDLTIPPTPENIEATARRYFDKSPADSMLGARGTSDYVNYYGAWAIGVIAPAHNRSVRDQPMQLDLASLGLIRQIMEENGIDLHGVQQQAYVDASTQPPTRDFFHHTMGTFRYVPPTATPVDRPNDSSTDRAFEAARLASLGFAQPPTALIRLPSGKQLSARGRPAGGVRNARSARTPQSNSVS